MGNLATTYRHSGQNLEEAARLEEMVVQMRIKSVGENLLCGARLMV